MKVGDGATLTHVITEADVAAYRALGGAAPAPGEAPPLLIGALFSRLLGVDLPGPGTNYLKQETRYLAPVPLGAPLTARVTVTRLRPEKHLVDLETVCEGPDGARLAEGRALVHAGDTGLAYED